MILCKLDFPIDSRIELSASSEEGYFYSRSDRNVFIVPESISGTTIISYFNEFESWDHDNIMRAQASAVTTDEEKHLARTVYFSKDTKSLYEAGYKDTTFFTRIKMAFELDDISELDDGEPLKNIIKWAEEVVSDFVYTYKMAGQDTDIKKPRIGDSIPMISVFVSEDYEFNSDGFEGELKLYKQQFRTKDHRITGIAKLPLDNKMETEVVSYFRKGYKPRTFEKLIIDAKDNAIQFQEHEISIILSQVAFDIFIKELIIEFCEAKSIKLLEINRGKNHQEKIDYKEAVDKYDISEAFYILTTLSGYHFKSFSEYNKWYHDTYKKRNSIIHKRARGFDENDSDRAWTAATNFITAIQNKVYNQTNT